MNIRILTIYRRHSWTVTAQILDRFNPLHSIRICNSTGYAIILPSSCYYYYFYAEQDWKEKTVLKTT